MFLEGVIEVIISLVFTWFILSTAIVQIQEWIAARLRWRATELENAITRMLNDRALTRLFYDHPIIRSLSAQEKDRASRPSYIPSKQFSTVLLSILMGAGSESAGLIYGLYELEDQLGRIKSKPKRQQARDELKRIFELARLSTGTEGETAADNLILATLEKEITDFGGRYVELKETIEALRRKAALEHEQVEKLSKSFSQKDDQSPDITSLMKGILALGAINPGLRLILNSLLIGIDTSKTASDVFLQQFQANMESWFNDAMDRLSGWYKRRAQLTSFVIGLAAALLLNIDTVQMATQLWREPALRQAISANTELLMQQYSSVDDVDPIAVIQLAQEEYLGLPVGWNINAVQLLPEESCSFTPGARQVFGVNWNNECRRPFGAQSQTNGWLWLITKIAGLLMTGVACAQGSSFWFDVLMKVVNVRSAGIKPA